MCKDVELMYNLLICWIMTRKAGVFDFCGFSLWVDTMMRWDIVEKEQEKGTGVAPSCLMWIMERKQPMSF